MSLKIIVVAEYVDAGEPTVERAETGNSHVR